MWLTTLRACGADTRAQKEQNLTPGRGEEDASAEYTVAASTVIGQIAARTTDAEAGQIGPLRRSKPSNRARTRISYAFYGLQGPSCEGPAYTARCRRPPSTRW